VVGRGAAGLLGVPAAKHLGDERITGDERIIVASRCSLG
jgi:hypothetical protein